VNLLVCLLQINSTPLRFTPPTHTIYHLNSHDPGSAYVHNLFALTVYLEVTLDVKVLNWRNGS